MSTKFADSMSQMPAVGLPAGSPERPAEPAAYPAVHDIPAPRNSVTLTNFEQEKMEDDLMAARDQQQKSVGVAAQPKTARQVRQQKALQPPPVQPVVANPAGGRSTSAIY
jgi:hypothetical protein